ncbi:MAG: threonylcarbamoyl-AMP synthase [Bacteroidales bacterium]|nr:threonylcarbamoyl-AMP synthase [Bacteroidales bacterium]
MESQIEIQKEIDKTLEFLKKGKVILYPTDTVWGIGCDATIYKAVKKIYKIKQKEDEKSLIILLDSPESLEKYVENVPPIAYDLLENAVSPITIVYPKAKDVLKNIRAADGSIAIRVIKDDFCTELIRRLGKPLVSTSANLSGHPVATTFDQLDERIKENVDYIVGIHHARVASVKPSTIVTFDENGALKVIRP